jgi:hypothetical protein
MSIGITIRFYSRFAREAAVYPSGMTRKQAEAECARLAAESPNRTTHRWLPKEDLDGLVDCQGEYSTG